MKETAAYVMNIVVMLFSILLLFGMYVIGYFYYLRTKGIVTRDYKITFSAFDYELQRTRDVGERSKLIYGRKLYKIFIYTFYVIIPFLVLALIWNDRVGNI